MSSQARFGKRGLDQARHDKARLTGEDKIGKIGGDKIG